MRTLYVRNVPDDVAGRLEAQARAEGISVNALVVRELTEVACRAVKDNASLLADLPSHKIPADRIVSAVHAGRR